MLWTLARLYDIVNLLATLGVLILSHRIPGLLFHRRNVAKTLFSIWNFASFSEGSSHKLFNRFSFVIRSVCTCFVLWIISTLGISFFSFFWIRDYLLCLAQSWRFCTFCLSWRNNIAFITLSWVCLLDDLNVLLLVNGSWSILIYKSCCRTAYRFANAASWTLWSSPKLVLMLCTCSMLQLGELSNFNLVKTWFVIEVTAVFDVVGTDLWLLLIHIHLRWFCKNKSRWCLSCFCRLLTLDKICRIVMLYNFGLFIPATTRTSLLQVVFDILLYFL